MKQQFATPCVKVLKCVSAFVDGDESDDNETTSPSDQQSIPDIAKNQNKDEVTEQPRKSAAQLMRDKKKQTALTLQW